MQATPTSKNSTTVRKSSKPGDWFGLAPKQQLRLARAALQGAFAVSDDLGASLAEHLFITPRRHARPAREAAYLATARPLALEVTLRAPHRHRAKRTLAGWRWGFGPTVLLVHGWEGRGTQLGALVEPLVAAGLSVVAFDAPGHGDSPDRQLYLTDMADSIADVAAQVGPLHAIVAHSFGAAGVLLAHVRAGLDVPRTIFLAPNAIVDSAVSHFSKELGLDDSERTLFEQRLVAHTGVELSSLAIDQLAAHRDSALLVLHDHDDREVSLAQGRKLAATWPNAQLHETHELGHRRILRDPGVIAAVTAFACEGLPPPTSDLVREVDRYLAGAEA
ncbi:MAG: alpha/beta fold hydrolase [Kofleriaceae bacterium]